MKKKQKFTVALISAAGTGNFGDELIRDLWLRFYKNYSIIDISFSPVQDSTHENYTFVHNSELWNFKCNFSAVSLIHFAGGGYINDEFNTISKYTESLLRLEHKIPLVASGISLQPSEVTNTSAFLKQNFWLMGLRDFESFTQARKFLSCRASFSFDDTWRFSLKTIMKKVSRENRTIFINLQEQFDLAEESEYLSKVQEIVDVLKKLQEREPNLNISVIESDESDVRLKKELEKYNIDTTVITAKEWLRHGICFGKLDVLITSRFHPRLLFSRVGTSVKHIVVGSYYEKKHGDPSAKVFPYSDIDLESDSSTQVQKVSFILWKIRCLVKAYFFKVQLLLVLQRIRMQGYLAHNVNKSKESFNNNDS